MMRKIYLMGMAIMLLTASLPAQAQITVVEDTTPSTYEPTQIKNGDFSVEPWMDYVYNGTTYTSYPTDPIKAIVDASIPNGVDGGWNTTETYTWKSLFEYSTTMGTYNGTLNTNGNHNGHGGFMEMNAQNSAVLYQDLHTFGNDVIRWTLEHAVRVNDVSVATQSMRVEIGAPERDADGNIKAATGIGGNTNAMIIDNTEATYTASEYSGYNGYRDDSQANLSLSTTGQQDNWYKVTGVYCIPEGQTVTRFAFTATQSTQQNLGNLLDNITFSTLIGNLSAVHHANGNATLSGYWGETDDTKHLEVMVGSTKYEVNMSSVEGKNFVVTIPKSIIGTAEQIAVYHEDYAAAKRTVAIVNTIDITAHEDPKNAGVYYTTYYDSSVKYQLPEGVEAYIAKLGDDVLQLKRIASPGQVIPYDCGVILKAASPNITLTISDATPVSYTAADNSLLGVDNTTYVNVAPGYTDGCRVYILYGTASQGVGFYNFIDNNTQNNDLTAHKAYVVLGGTAAAAPALLFNFDDATAVHEVERSGTATPVYYDLQGRRVEKPKKGVYVVNGRKVMVK